MRVDRRQFEWMVLRHLDAAYNVARWYLRNDQDAEDAVQDSVLNAYNAFAKFSGSDGKPWLLKIVRNNCIRRLQNQKRFSVEPLEDDTVLPSYTNPNDPEAQLIRSADAGFVRMAIAGLPEVYREVIVLREFEELSYAEIAEIAGVPLGTVMSRLARARTQLAAQLHSARSEGTI